ncbi:TonB-dependent receptor [Sphingomonas sp. RRHST34]|uniref:TonB-dependent receptor n=1 Tax=Sphingomonas citri TaxID=2862499 RepID=A0ABS7BSD4_9SPHN|nr:TonB-dependent receptor [Sphingomonas citri]MBW6532515.1 TonB-dependent receptor [Sphingomonas citri]
MRTSWLLSVSALSVVVAPVARAQSGTVDLVPPTSQDAPSAEAAEAAPAQDIVIVGQRASLVQAADIKQRADQVVDSIVADDIGKFPDTSVASALQRIPGVQVAVNSRNEVGGPIIRGLDDILTTLNGREVFTGAGRGFAFEDLPAEALAQADVYKSSSADLIEGGVAGVVNLNLQKPLRLKAGTTLAANVRAIYGERVGRTSITANVLAAHHWDGAGGEFGVLVNASVRQYQYSRQTPFNDNLLARNIPGVGGVILPAAQTGLNANGHYTRPQGNFALQWKPSVELEFYIDGLYAGDRTTRADNYILYDNVSAQSMTNVDLSDDCSDYQVGGNGFYSPTGSVGRYCVARGFTANNLNALTATEAHRNRTDNYQLGGGVKYDSGRLHLMADLSWVRSVTSDEGFRVLIGKPIASVTVRTNEGGQPLADAVGLPLADPSDFRFTYGLDDSFSRAAATLKAARFDARYDVGGIVDELQFGGRIAERKAEVSGYYQGGGAPGGAFATPISNYDLGSGFLGASSVAGFDGGATFSVPRTDYLLEAANQDVIRAVYGLPAGRPVDQAERGYSVRERTYAAYGQVRYDVPISGALSLDGLVGVRFTKTDRDIAGAGRVFDDAGGSSVVAVARSTSDSDFLPNASARLKIGSDLQARVTYAKAISRPGFGSLNPGINYTLSTSDYILNSGSAGNPDLRPQKSDSYDATLEYYLGRRGYLALGAYRKNITDRVVGQVARETIAGIEYNINRPRNVGSATLQGIEASGQVFLDFLPGAFGGLGVFANYTYADSEVTTPGDTLEGYALTGVSKNNYNVGLLYEKFGLSARAVYNWRSAYNLYEQTQGQDVRPVDTGVYFTRAQPQGRLDASINYDVGPNMTITFDGLNLTGAKTRTFRSYQDEVLVPRDYSYDERSFLIGVRLRY